jgi:16S rRNA (guanine966-N2)-methyltransferase
MRVIAGEARGLTLRAPRGLETRPTSDLMRGVIFSILDSMKHEFARVLDLYAGSGALGIEALSRGADRADFVERSTTACAVIRSNLERARYTARARVLCATVARALPRLDDGYNLIFCDPPYADHSIESIFSSMAAASLWTRDVILVYEHSRKESPPDALGELRLFRSRAHGSSSVSFYRIGAEGQDE